MTVPFYSRKAREDEESGIYEYLWAWGKLQPCSSNVVPHENPHHHIDHPSRWTNSGTDLFIGEDVLREDFYYLTLKVGTEGLFNVLVYISFSRTASRLSTEFSGAVLWSSRSAKLFPSLLICHGLSSLKSFLSSPLMKF